MRSVISEVQGVPEISKISGVSQREMASNPRHSLVCRTRHSGVQLLQVAAKTRDALLTAQNSEVQFRKLEVLRKRYSTPDLDRIIG